MSADPEDPHGDAEGAPGAIEGLAGFGKFPTTEEIATAVTEARLD